MALSEKVIVRLAPEQRRALRKIVRGGSHPAAMQRRAHILLKTDININNIIKKRNILLTN